MLEGWRFDWNRVRRTRAGLPGRRSGALAGAGDRARALAAAGFPGGTGLALQRTGVIIGNTLTGDSSRAAALRLRWPYVRRVLR